MLQGFRWRIVEDPYIWSARRRKQHSLAPLQLETEPSKVRMMKRTLMMMLGERVPCKCQHTFDTFQLLNSGAAFRSYVTIQEELASRPGESPPRAATTKVIRRQAVTWDFKANINIPPRAGFRAFGVGVWGLGFRGLEFGVWGLGFLGVWGG